MKQILNRSIALVAIGLLFRTLSAQQQIVEGRLTLAQQTVLTSGGDASGSGGTFSYSVGLISYSSLSASSGMVAQGIQQSYNSPALTTAGSSAVTTNSASVSATLISDGGDPVTVSGFCWSTSSQNPTLSDSYSSDGAASGTFSSSLTGLTPGTTYYVRAYATNAIGTSYGNRISFTPLVLGSLADVTKTYGDAAFALTKPTSASPGAFTYSSSNTNVATVSGNRVSIVGAGSATITATQAASGGYGSVQTSASLTVDKANQVLTLSPLPNQQPLNTFSSIDLTASSSAGLTPVISLGAGSAALLNGSNQLVSIGATGSVTVVLNQAGNTNYNSASLSQSFDVVKTNQLITFSSLSNSYYGDAAFALSGSSNSALSVSYTSSNPAVASISGNTVSIVGVGTTNITASQSGDGNYNPAPDVLQSFSVLQAGATVNATTALSGIGFDVALSGGNILSEGGSTVTARGVCWSTNVHPTVALATKTTNGTGSGSFSSSISGLSSATTYYVRAYATNSVGTTYGPELNFTTNILVATTKNTDALPACTTCDVTVESTGTLNVNTELVAQNLTLKADNNSSFSASVGNGITVNGNLRYVKTMDRIQWYFISFPCDVPLSDITDAATGESLGTLGVDWFVNYYDGESRVANLGTVSNWKDITDTKLIAYKGYIFGLKDGLGTVDVAFNLSKSLIESETSKSVPVVAYGITSSVGANHKGWNLVGQPYLSRYSGNNASVNYMVFPSAVNNGQTYDVVYKDDGGRVIDPFTSYFVQAGNNQDIPFDIAGRQLAPASVKVNEYDRTIFTLTTPTGSDNTSLIMDDAQSADYQIGQDMEKWIGTGTTKPQLYTQLGSINYAFNSLPASSVVNLPLSFYSKSGGTSILSLDASQAPGIACVYLTDKVTGVTTDLKSSTYSFTAASGTVNTRFVVNVKKVATAIQTIQTGNGATISTVNGKLILSGITENTDIRIYDAVGRMVVSKTLTDNLTEIPFAVTGVYVIRLHEGEKTQTYKLIIKK